MAKRKRTPNGESAKANAPIPSKKAKSTPNSSAPPSKTSKSPLTIQIITGSYDRVLHGITATVSHKHDNVQFADTFLFTAHTSSIRSLALSPPSAPTPNQSQKVILATGSTDERINLYHLSAHTPSKITVPAIPSLTSKAVVENPQNRELGSLLHHSSAITRLYFPNRGKLLSSAEDSTIAVTRTRDWSLLSTIKAPIPKSIGRPSGDTAPAGGAPSGVNDFAVHPSMKLMISVGKGEKSMRLWNLVTGKKAGVLSFERGMLQEVGEGRFSSGEGRKVAWGADGEAGGEEFCVAFERGILVFGMDSKPKCKAVPEPRTKIHHTEVEGKEAPLATARLIAQLGGKDANITGRIKDFTVFRTDSEFIVATASSDGALRLWNLSDSDLAPHTNKTRQVGKLIGVYETTNRITCLTAFLMLPKIEGAEDEDIEDDAGVEEEHVASDGEDSE